MSEIDALIQSGKGGVYINVHAQPGARRPSLRGIHGDALKIAVREAAQDGKANASILKFTAELLGCAKQQVELASGHASRSKRLFVHGDADAIARKLRSILDNV